MDINTLKIHTYDTIVLRATVDEPLDNIDLGVLYWYHGDEYFLVKTTEGVWYKYGLFINLRWERDIDQLGPEYVRKPFLFKKDDRCATSNEVYFSIENFCKKDRTSFEWRRYSSESSAQYSFEYLLRRLDAAFMSGYRYDLTRHKEDIIRCLEINNIWNERNQALLEMAKLSTKDELGTDGIAAKKRVNMSDDGKIDVDNVVCVIKDGKELSSSEWFISQCNENDSDGFPMYYFALDQFDKDVVKNVKKGIADDIKGIRESLEEIEARLSEANLKKLYDISDMLSGVWISWPEDECYDDEDEED